MEYTKDNPEFKINFNSAFSFGTHFTATTFRASDGAYICPGGDKDGTSKLYVVPPKTVNGQISYDWKDAKTIPCSSGQPIVDVLAQDDRFYVLRDFNRALGTEKINSLECYDESGKLLWTRDNNDNALQSLQSLGDGMFTVMDRGWADIGPIMIRNKDGDLVSHVTCRDNADCWSNGALRADADTAYIGLVQVYKVTGLSSVKSASATVTLPRADHH